MANIFEQFGYAEDKDEDAPVVKSGNVFEQFGYAGDKPEPELEPGVGEMLRPAHEPVETVVPEPEERSLGQKTAEVAGPVVKPAIEGVGILLGGAAGSALGPAGGVAGAGLGYGMAKQVSNKIDEYAGKERPPLADQLTEAGKDVLTGAAYQAGGEGAAQLLYKGASVVGKVGSAILGRMSGAGTEAVREAFKSTAGSSKLSTDFVDALRGKIKPESVVQNAKAAVESIKSARSQAYREALKQIANKGEKVPLDSVRQKVADLMSRYNIQATAEGLDTSRIAMGKAGRRDIEEIIDTVAQWGSKQGDDTALGLDTLKRQLDDFYSESSQARQFVTELKNSVKQAISDVVPQYKSMTESYSEVTTLLKDIESGLMLRKQGISGRVVADQTLRRLTSAMKENFALRKELLDVLGNESGQQLSQQVAGYALSGVVPKGLAGSGPVLALQGAYSAINPKFLPVLAASSPRVQGEFMRALGRAYRVASRIPKQTLTMGAMAADGTRDQKP